MSPTLSGIFGKCVAVTSLNAPLPCPRTGGSAVGGAHDDVDDAVAGEVASLDYARDVRCRAEHLSGLLDELLARPHVEEDAARLGRSRLRVVAPVGEEQVGPAVLVQVGHLFVRHTLVSLMVSAVVSTQSFV
jgi:hypothetical protein